jgi:hypothetical protein
MARFGPFVHAHGVYPRVGDFWSGWARHGASRIVSESAEEIV